jgi:4-deoxy-L-threo-5-hexosulose-uronate ketol-isomerase
MEQRYATNPDQVPCFDTAELRRRYLVDGLFAPGQVKLVYTQHDRIVMGGLTPVDGPLALTAPDGLRAPTFFANREAGIVNIGGPGLVTVAGREHRMGRGACLYLGLGVPDPSMASEDPSDPARFYIFSAPAHTTHPVALVDAGSGATRALGDPLTSNQRVIRQYIHGGGVQSCQVMMGVTTLQPGSMWNTMPAHTHDRRTECYLYFDLPPEACVIHLMGEPKQTRHLVVTDGQGVISPSWSVHAGVGTASYSFVWAMAGENKAFDDMDAVTATQLR